MNKKVSDALEEFEETDDSMMVPFYKRRSFIYLAIACIALVGTAVAAVFYKNHPDLDNISGSINNDLPAGTYKASLLFPDGSKFSLSDAEKAEVLYDKDIRIVEGQGGELHYEVVSGLEESLSLPDVKKAGRHELRTPRGGYYKVSLSDGTRVWLNAASVLRYPEKFSEKDRTVELEGEAYFEVSNRDSVPFLVKTRLQQSQVTAGRFNISAYADDPATRTTVLEGKLDLHPLDPVRKNGDHLLSERNVSLETDDQAQLSTRGLTLVKVHRDEAISWKNGYFQFNDSDLKSVMREMSRWYNADVIYEGTIPNVKFSGEVRRDVSASTFLEMLAYLKVKFKIRKNDQGKNEIIVRRQKNN